MHEVKWTKSIVFLFPQMVRGQRNNIPTQATFVTLSRALCSNGILALFGIAQMPAVSALSPSITDVVQREEMIDRFKIPRNACTSAGKLLFCNMGSVTVLKRSASNLFNNVDGLRRCIYNLWTIQNENLN